VMYYDQPIRWTYYEGGICDIRCAITADGYWGNGSILGGTTDGTVRQLHYGTTDGGSSISSYWISRWHDMGNAATRSRALMVALLVGDDGATSVGVSTAWDYTASAWVESTGVSKMFGNPGVYFDSAKFDVDVFDATAAGVRVYEMPASGHFMRVRILGTAPWTVDGWAILADEKGRA